jgi:hypothetical protein
LSQESSDRTLVSRQLLAIESGSVMSWRQLWEANEMGDWEDMTRVSWTARTRGRMWGKVKSSGIARGPPRHDWIMFGSLMGSTHISH